MPQSADQIVTAGQMRSAEQALVDQGISIDELMQRAGRGAAEWVWRMAAQWRVTVLCGPGNNGGDGYVIAEAIRERGGAVRVIAASEPKTGAAKVARSLYAGEVLGADSDPHGDVLVDCLYGSGLTRPLSDSDTQLLARMVAGHRHAIAIDVPSGIEADTGALLASSLPHFDLTIALGAWKFAHFLMPARAMSGALRLVGIGVGAVQGAAQAIARPCLQAPAADAHKYRRGLLAVIAGEMPGASLLACTAAQGAGAGYVRLLGETPLLQSSPDLVSTAQPLSEALSDARINALLIGPGLGRHGGSRERLAEALASPFAAVLDADALVLLAPRLLAGRSAPIVATPHEGELAALERALDLAGSGTKADRARALAKASGMIVVAKGPDTIVAAPDGRMAMAHRASSWLSVAGTGDVLAGTIASRLAAGADPFEAACQGVWLHGEAARLAGPAFAASQLASAIPAAYAACL